jgi:hypothetical protein
MVVIEKAGQGAEFDHWAIVGKIRLATRWARLHSHVDRQARGRYALIGFRRIAGNCQIVPPLPTHSKRTVPEGVVLPWETPQRPPRSLEWTVPHVLHSGLLETRLRRWP